MYACSIVGKLWQCPGWDFFEAHTHSHRHTCICLYMSPICSWELSRPATAQSNWSVVPLAFWSVTISTASKVSAGNSEGQVPSKLCQQEYVLFSNLLKKKEEWNTQTHIYFIIPILKICASRHMWTLSAWFASDKSSWNPRNSPQRQRETGTCCCLPFGQLIFFNRF